MAIKLQTIVNTPTVKNDLLSVREEILAAARDAEANGRHDTLIVDIEGGWPYLPSPFVLSATENPELAHVDITLRGKNGDTPHIHAFHRIELSSFEKVEGKPYLRYQLKADENGKYPLFHNLFFNANSISPATTRVWRNPDTITNEERTGEKEKAGFYIPTAVANALASGELGAAELNMYVEWEAVTIHLDGVKTEDTRDFGGESYTLVTAKREEMNAFCRDCHRILNTAGRETFITNSPAILTEPDTYAYDYANGVIYVLPANEDTTGQFVQYATVENYFRLEGLENFTLENIEFTGTTSSYVCEHIYHSGQANNVKHAGRLRHAAVIASNMTNFTVKGCVFRDLGGNGLLLTDATNRAFISDCLFDNIGMSALSIGNPTTKWEDPINRNFNIRVENNLFRHIAYEYPTSLCIFVGMVDTLKILHNTIEGCGYSAMSIGWGWEPVPYSPGEKVNTRNVEIAYNYIHNYMDRLRDGGAIYVLGGCANPSICSERFNRMHDNYAELDVMRDGSKYGYYCDGSSSNWDVSHSVIVNCATPLYSQTHPGALSYHNHLHDVYSTTEYRREYHAPGRDVLFYDNHILLSDKEALFEKYPEAKAIHDAAGANLKF